MLTRRTYRRAFMLAGIALGAIGLLLFLFSLILTARFESPRRQITIGRGAIVFKSFEELRSAMPNPKHPAPGEPMFLKMRPGWIVSTRSDPWYWMPLALGGTQQQTATLLIPWWLLTTIGLISLYFYLPPGHTRGHCQRCNFDLANLPKSTDNPAQITCPECGYANHA